MPAAHERPSASPAAPVPVSAPPAASPSSSLFLPAVERGRHASALDALLALELPQHEAQDLAAAACLLGHGSIFASVDGGRLVVALHLPAAPAEAAWAACNAYPELAAATPQEAARRLAKVLRRGRHGHVAALPPGLVPDAFVE